MKTLGSIFGSSVGNTHIPERISNGVVTRVNIINEVRLITLWVHFGSLIPHDELIRTEKLYAKSLDSSVVIKPHYGRDLFTVKYFPELYNAARREIPSINGTLNNADVKLEGKDLLITLYNGGKAILDAKRFDEVLSRVGGQPEYQPDFVICLGDTIVSKRLKKFLRGCNDCYFVAANESGNLSDTFMNLRHWVHCDAWTMLLTLADVLREKQPQPTAFRDLWGQALTRAKVHADQFVPAFSQMAAVRLFEQHCDNIHHPSSITHHPIIHYANSMAIRLANIYARHYVYCNRGVNGIEGSLSTAAGFSLVADKPVFCVIGDLSFFYDSNALWNSRLGGNLRILLLNNGGGGIFRQLPVGDGRSEALCSVMGTHHTSAEGICRSYGVEYLSARDMPALSDGLSRLMQMESSRPVLLEVFTDSAEDVRVIREYYRTFAG